VCCISLNPLPNSVAKRELCGELTVYCTLDVLLVVVEVVVGGLLSSIAFLI